MQLPTIYTELHLILVRIKKWAQRKKQAILIKGYGLE